MTVTGPVRGGAHGWPFGATVADLPTLGYVEEEYFLSGEAERYRPTGDLGPDGQWSVEPAGTAHFRTRLVVRRPIDPERFNGTVLVEWSNVSGGLEVFEAGDTPVVFDEGFAAVAVSAQRVGIHGFPDDPHGLAAWDPERYGDLDVPDDGLSYGIFTAAARALGPDRPAGPVDPLGGLPVRRLIALGGSQSAARLVTYLNAVQPLTRAFDGFVPFTWFGGGSSVDDPADVDLRTGGLDVLRTLPTQVRTDLDVPVLVVNSECETLSYFPVRQPDSDLFRFWEVAGAPHGPRLHMERLAPKFARDLPAAPAAATAALSPVPWAPVLDAAIAHVHRWRPGALPPAQEPIAVDAGPDGPRIRRDGDGNAVGGVRVPELVATLGRHTAALEEAGEGGLFGRWEPLPADVVAARYPDRDTYLAAYAAAARQAVSAGVLRADDVAAGLARAAAEPLP